jgi:type IV pilus assembly protein PilM
MILNNKKISYFGLDISDLSFKLAGVYKKKNNFELVNYNKANIPSGYFDDGKIIKIQECANLIKELVNSSQGPKIKTKFTHVCLPEKHTFIKIINLPPMSEAEIPSAIEWAAEHHLPFSLDEIYFDYHLIDNKSENHEIAVVIGAAPKEIVDDYTKMIKLAGLNPLSLEIEALAIARSIFPEEKNMDKAQAIVDLGANRSSLIICAQNAVQFSISLSISGNKITQIISQSLKITPQQAETAKIVCGFDPKKCKGGIKIILEKELDNLANLIISGLNYYQENITKSIPVEKIILTGGGANMLQLNSIFTEKVKLPSEIAPIVNNIKISNKLNITDNNLLSLATAIGLAIK